MSSLTIVTMVLICSVVWGGLLTLLAVAMRKEGARDES